MARKRVFFGLEAKQQLIAVESRDGAIVAWIDCDYAQEASIDLAGFSNAFAASSCISGEG
jgi:hypothetical protein